MVKIREDEPVWTSRWIWKDELEEECDKSVIVFKVYHPLIYITSPHSWGEKQNQDDSYREWEMLWEHKPTGECFHSFFEFS